MSDPRPIGVFDSGIGGASVVSKLQKHLPFEHIIYLADTKRLPYGEKSPQEIQSYVQGAIGFFFRHNVKCLVLACHTASVHALSLFDQHPPPFPIFGMVEPTLSLLKEEKTLALLATQSTLTSGIYRSDRCKIFPLACPSFVLLAEQGLFDHPIADLVASSYLKHIPTSVDAILLGCTHYPLCSKAILNASPPSVRLLDPAERLASNLFLFLEKNDLLSSSNTFRFSFYTSQKKNFPPVFFDPQGKNFPFPIQEEEFLVEKNRIE